ncbi:type II secretion system protein [Ammonifex thiophilus]|uniref:Type II secretion system protein n=1 Tax=Ammonifex thiophilus TaxID=444093 RepID=A0A3D8P3Q7_9THEO|nr:type II secretion system protein [Ammonifex thiophilus]RDV82077.1 type II secretion system protein [Ammonifex thiophilus]
MKERVRKVFRRLKGQGGFTLIELLIVIAIMGFLIAMIAPRLAKVASGASDTVCDTNQMRLRQVLAAYTEKTGQLPNYLTSLVCHDDAGKAVDPSTQWDMTKEEDGSKGWYIDNNNKVDGQEVLSKDFYAMTKLGLLTLDQAAADELRALGISKIYYLNVNQDVKAMEYIGNEVKKLNEGIPKHVAGKNDFMQEDDVKAGTAVLAVGFGDNHKLDPTAGPKKIGHPDRIGCIVLGVGPNSELVREGQIQHAGLCPNGIKRGDHFLYNNYNIVVPRLASVADKIVAAYGGTNGVKLTFKNEETGETKIVDIAKGQGEEVWQFTTFCPEGCNPMAADRPVWVLDKVETY